MKNIKFIVILLIIVGALVFIKLTFFQGVSGSPKGMSKGDKQPPGAVTTFIAHQEKFTEQIKTTGTVLANEEAELRPEVAGKVSKLLFSEGSAVAANTLLVKINDADLRAQLQKVELQIKLAEEKEGRQKKLLEIEGVSKEGYDISTNEVNTLKADRDYLYAQIRKTEIRAPFSGVVGLRTVSEGSYVSPTTIVASIQQLHPLKIDFSIPEKYAALLSKGDVVDFRTEGITKVFKAKVFAIEPKIDLATRTVKVRALCYDHQNKLFPGAFVKIDLAKESASSILIPTEALIPELKGHKVFLYRQGKAISHQVVAGTRTDTRVLINEGLQEGDTIITSGTMQLKDSSAVHILKSSHQ